MINGGFGALGGGGGSGGGDTGPRGNTGFQGFKGPQGFSGFQGNGGVQGFKGSQGFSGFQGFDGPTGATGATGSTGECGGTGPTGITGSTGDMGFQGFEGPSGASGDSGPIGTLNFLNDWSDSTTYQVNDIVTVELTKYIAIGINYNSYPPSNIDVYWKVFSINQTGPTGAAGTSFQGLTIGYYFTTGTEGSGKLRANATDPSLITELKLGYSDSYGVPVSTLLNAYMFYDTSHNFAYTVLKISSNTTPNIYYYYLVNSASDGGSYLYLSLSAISGNTANFTEDEAITFSIQQFDSGGYTGDRGIGILTYSFYRGKLQSVAGLT